MLPNFAVLIIVLLLAFSIMLYLRSRTNSSDIAVNSLLNRRKKRESSAIANELKTSHQSSNLPDVATEHQHESKVKEVKQTQHKLPAGFHELSLTKSLKPEIKQRIRASIQTMRKPHPLLHRLTNTEPDPKKLYDIIRTDPELVAKIINVANSPLFGLSKAITNVNHAVVYLGVIQVKNIATHFALQETIQFDNKIQKLAYERIWSASYLASSIALFVGKELSFENTAELSTRCQLGYLGDISIIFAQAKMSKVYTDGSSLFDRIKNAHRTFGADASLVGKLLSLQWKLPSSICNGVGNSLLPFTNQFDELELEEEQIREILVCYFCSRIADLVIFSNKDIVNTLAEFNFEKSGLSEFYYLEEQLKRYQLDKLLDLVGSVHFKTQLTNVINEANTGQHF